jgi:glycosyltransferase involved in cell wall biosynthesis
MKVLSVIESLGRAGAEQVLVNQLPRLQEIGYRCQVVALWEPYTLAPVLEARGVKVYRLDLGRRCNVAKAIVRLGILIDSVKPDIIHAHLFFALIYTAMTRLVAPRPRRVATFHNVDYLLYPPNTYVKRLRRALHGLLSYYGIDKLTAVSASVANHYRAQLGLSEISVIPNAIMIPNEVDGTANNRREMLKKFGFSERDFIFAMIGRFVPQKGHKLLLEALELLREINCRPRVIMIGEGALREQIVRQVRTQGLEEQIVLVPACPHSEVISLLRAVDAFVMPSVEEGLGLVAGEAMAAGLPVVATRVNGLSDLIEDGVSGLLVPPGDSHALANAIAKVMMDGKLRQHLGRGGRERIEQHFSIEQILPRWDALYRNILPVP